jgi:pimeloyl-ACP methyl ester carboxylesterase
MKEVTFQFGPGSGLVGTLTTPDAPAARSSEAVLLFNAGVVPRVGPHRLNVRMARALAAEGFTAFRFDLSGRGDSAPAPGMESYEKQSIIDVRAAMDAVAQRTGIRRFMIMGVCSGAENGYHTALVDERIVALSLLDPYHFPTWKTHLNRYRHRARARGGLIPATLHWFAVRLGRAVGKRQEQSWAEPDFGSIRPHPSDYARKLGLLLDRGVKIQIMYSGNFVESYNYAGQFRDVFGRYGVADRVEAEYRADMNHMATALHEQRELIAHVCEFFRQCDARSASRG